MNDIVGIDLGATNSSNELRGQMTKLSCFGD
jgi:hypothetical protein